MLPPEMQPNQVISLLDLGGPSFALANHWDHIHIGFAPVPYTISRSNEASRRRRTRACSSSGSRPARPTACRGRCSRRSTRSSRTTGRTWARAPPARSAGCSSSRRPGPSGAWTRTATASPTRRTRRTRSTPPRATSARRRETNLPRAIYSYNHAQWYVNEVLQLASLFGDSSSAGMTFAGMGLPQFTLAAATTPAAPERPNSLPDTALGHGAVIEEDVAAPTTIGHGVVVDDAASAPTLPPASVLQQAKLEAGFSILRALIGGGATPTASDKLASNTPAASTPTLRGRAGGRVQPPRRLPAPDPRTADGGSQHARQPARLYPCEELRRRDARRERPSRGVSSSPSRSSTGTP